MARPSKKAAAAAQPEKSVADAAWSKVFPAQEGLSCLSLLSAVQDLQEKYSRHEVVTPHDARRHVLGDGELIPFARLMDELAQLRDRLPPLLQTLGVVFDDRTPKLAMKQWELKPPSKRGPAPKPLPSRFDFDLTNVPPNAIAIPFIEVTMHLVRIVDEVAYLLHDAAKSSELPDGWEGKPCKIGRTEKELERLPVSPILNFQQLRTWLESLLKKLDLMPWTPPKSKLDDVQRELRNARRALRKRIDDPTERPEFNDNPADIHDAEKQLEKLIDWLGKKPPADEKPAKPRRGRPKGSVTSDPIADAMVANKWANGRREYATHEELAAGLPMPLDEVKAALKRHASRRKHDK